MDYLLPFPQDVLSSGEDAASIGAPSSLLGDLQSGELGASVGIFELLTTFPPNWLPLTGFYDAQVHEIAKHNTQALYFGGCGELLTGDVIVSTGHRHDTIQSWLSWREIATFLFENNGGSSIGSSPDECVDALAVTVAAAETDLSWQHIRLLPIEAQSITPRVRVSHAAGTVNTVLSLYYYDLAMNLLTLHSLAVNVGTAENRIWHYFPAINLADLPDDFSGKRPALVKFTGAKAIGSLDVAVHELGFGVTTP